MCAMITCEEHRISCIIEFAIFPAQFLIESVSFLWNMKLPNVGTLWEGIGVKILEVVNAAVGLKLTGGSLKSVVQRRISRNSNQLSQLEASCCN